MKNESNMNAEKIHLGCGERYLNGYLNVDFPPSEHTVQSKSVADRYGDLRELKYPASSISEVRLHHVFEHFIRPEAVSLVFIWSSWLKFDGTLHIEIPDFKRSVRTIFWNPFSSHADRAKAVRHLFGSHEASWAVHCEGWTDRALKDLFQAAGIRLEKIQRSSWQGIHNAEYFGKKTEKISRKDALARIRSYLKGYCVDDSSTEQKLLEIWVRSAEQRLSVGFAEQA